MDGTTQSKPAAAFDTARPYWTSLSHRRHYQYVNQTSHSQLDLQAGLAIN
jgi:hypothetical protein